VELVTAPNGAIVNQHVLDGIGEADIVLST